MKSKPSYYEFFTQGKSDYFDWARLDVLDMGWIDELNKQRVVDKQKRIEEDIAEGRDPENSFSSDEDILSKDFNSTDFPLMHEWSKEFKSVYDVILSSGRHKINSMVKTAEQKLDLGHVTLYVSCDDGNHYFSTPYFANGEIMVASIDDDSHIDSVDTAVYMFINEYNQWQEKYGEAYEAAVTLSNLEALRQPCGSENDVGCEHEDLGSLGYVHGSMVTCPYCGNMVEVW